MQAAGTSAVLDELDFVKWQLSRLPTRAYLSDVTTGHGECVGSAGGCRIMAGTLSTVAVPPMRRAG